MLLCIEQKSWKGTKKKTDSKHWTLNTFRITDFQFENCKFVYTYEQPRQSNCANKLLFIIINFKTRRMCFLAFFSRFSLLLPFGRLLLFVLFIKFTVYVSIVNTHVFENGLTFGPLCQCQVKIDMQYRCVQFQTIFFIDWRLEDSQIKQIKLFYIFCIHSKFNRFSLFATTSTDQTLLNNNNKFRLSWEQTNCLKLSRANGIKWVSLHKINVKLLSVQKEWNNDEGKRVKGAEHVPIWTRTILRALIRSLMPYNNGAPK